MTIYSRIRTLSAAALLAVAVVGLSTTQADARPKGPGTSQPKLCSLPGSAVGSTNDWEFYTPGAEVSVTDGNGVSHILACGHDGNWVVVIRPTSPGAGPLAPQPAVNAP